jgi:hypothetical protein
MRCLSDAFREMQLCWPVLTPRALWHSSEFTLFRELIQNANDGAYPFSSFRVIVVVGVHRSYVHACNTAGATHIEIVLTSPSYRVPSATPSEPEASALSAAAAAVPESSASSAASSILNIFKFGSWAAGPVEKEKDKPAGDDKRAKAMPAKPKDHTVQFGSCDATEIKVRCHSASHSRRAF